MEDHQSSRFRPKYLKIFAKLRRLESRDRDVIDVDLRTIRQEGRDVKDTMPPRKGRRKGATTGRALVDNLFLGLR